MIHEWKLFQIVSGGGGNKIRFIFFLSFDLKFDSEIHDNLNKTSHFKIYADLLHTVTTESNQRVVWRQNNQIHLKSNQRLNSTIIAVETFETFRWQDWMTSLSSDLKLFADFDFNFIMLIRFVNYKVTSNIF